MTAYVGLLRGVNLVGRSSLRMADLTAIAEELGLANVRTYIVSGNLLFGSDKPEDELRRMLEQRLRAHMARDVRVMLRTAAEMEAVVGRNPFSEVPSKNVQVYFLDQRPPADLLETVRNQDDERVATGTREVYVAYGERGIGRSRLRIPAAEAGTARNMNTVAKLAELARGWHEQGPRNRAQFRRRAVRKRLRRAPRRPGAADRDPDPDSHGRDRPRDRLWTAAGRARL